MDAEGGTVLRFGEQTTGAQNILATGNNFVIQDLAVEKSPGDAIKIEGSNGVTIRRVRVEWTNGPDENNGAYGLYPMESRNVLIEDCEVRGASEAGVYVGQVPAGTGLMIMANDDIEAFGNTITGNISFGVLIVSYYFVDLDISKPTYDPVPEKIFVHENTMSNNGGDPQGDAALVGAVIGGQPDIFYDSSGVGTDAGLLVEFPDGLSESQAICINDNGVENTFGRFNISVILGGLPYDPAISTDPEYFNCQHASLPPIELEPPVDPNNPNAPPIDTEALCNAQGTGVNTDAVEANYPNLSDYRLFADPANPMANANGNDIIYDLNTPLFTDYANKYRFVFVPEGAPAAYRSQDVFDFPVGTIISKTFTLQADLRDANSSEEIIETRLLIHRKEGWTALPYIWNDEKTDAVLTVTGGTQAVSWIDIDGVQQSTDYVIPNTNNCSNCHGEDELIPIGPTARSLNREYAYDGVAENQLAHWTALGILSGAPADTDSIDTIPLWGDTSASLDDRARGYLDINCAHCHRPVIGAADTSGLFLEYFRPFGTEVGKCKPPVAAGDGAGDLDYDIVPGDADTSIMHYRMNSKETKVRMPEIGRSIIHTEGVELIRDWINAMDPVDCAAL